ncbi:MAG: hypothetical protein ABIV47_17950 [Roseiflexaceae bacterium]
MPRHKIVTQLSFISRPSAKPSSSALSFATGVLVPAAAVGAILLNINIMLSGIGTPAFDGPIIAAQVLFLMSYRVVGGIDFERLAQRILSAALLGFAAVGGVGLALAWSSLLPLGFSVDAVHHTQLITYQVTARVHDFAAGCALEVQGSLDGQARIGEIVVE